MSRGPLGPGATIGVLGAGQLGRMLAPRGAAPRLPRAHLLARHGLAHRPGRRPRGHRQLRRPRRAARASPTASTPSPSSSRTCRRRASPRSPSATLVRPAGSVLHTTQHRGREKAFLSRCGHAGRPVRARRRPARISRPRVARLGCPAVLKTASFGYDGKGQARVDRRRRRARGVGPDRAPAGGARGVRRLRARGLGRRRARRRTAASPTTA